MEQTLKGILNEMKDDFFAEILTNAHATPCRSRDQAPPMTYNDLVNLTAAIGFGDMTEQLNMYKGMVFGMLELPAPPVDALAAEHAMVAEADTPALLSLHSWWMTPLLEFGRSQLTPEILIQMLPEVLPQVLPAGSTFTDGVLVLSLGPEMSDFDDLVDIGDSAVNVHVGEVRVTGLDTITELDLLQTVVSGDYTVLNSLTLDHIAIEANLTLTIDSVVEHVSVRTRISQPHFDLAFMVAIEDSLFDLSLSDALHDALGCALTKVFRSEVTEAMITAAGVDRPVIDGFSSATLDEISNRAIEAVFVMYDELGDDVLPGFVEQTLKGILNEMKDDFFSMLSTEGDDAICPGHEAVLANTYLDFNDLELGGFNLTQEFESLKQRIGESVKAELATIGGDSGRVGEQVVNGGAALVGPIQLNLTDFATKIAEFKAQHPDWEGRLPKSLSGPGVCLECSRIGVVWLEIGNLRMTGLDSVTELSVLNPVNHHSLHNSVNANRFSFSIDMDLKIDGSAPEDGSAPALHIDDRFTFTLDLEEIDFLFDVLFEVDETKLLELSLRSFIEMDLGTLVSSLAEVRVDSFVMDLEAAVVHVDCSEATWRRDQVHTNACSSSILREMAADENGANITPEINMFLGHLSEQVTSENVQRQIAVKLSEHSELAKEDVTLQLAVSENSAAVCEDFDKQGVCEVWKKNGECTQNPDFMKDHCRFTCGFCPTTQMPTLEDTTMTIWMVVAGIAAVCAACAARVYKVARVNRRRCNSPGESIPLSEGLINTARFSGTFDESEFSIESQSKAPEPEASPVSLVRDQRLPAWQRLLLPLFLLINIVIFVFGHIHIGASVDIYANMFGDHVRLDRFVEFSLGHSLIDMWNGKAFMLFWMVLAFSGVWPYLKLLLLLRCCFCPQSQQTVGSSTSTKLGQARACRSLLILLAVTLLIDGFCLMGKHVWFTEDDYTLLGSKVSSEILLTAALLITTVLAVIAVFDIALHAGMRGEILHMLDLAGTCSLIDLYVLAMCILAFRIHVESPGLAEVASEFYLFDVVVTPVAGLYAFIAGVCLSILLNYIALTLHRKTLKDVGAPLEYNAGRIMPAATPRLTLLGLMCAEAQEKQQKEEFLLGESSNKLCVCLIQILLLFAMLIGTIVVFIAGSLVTSFDFKVYGVLQYAIDIGASGSSLREYSLLSSIVEMAGSGGLDRYGGWLGTYFIAGIYGCFSFVVPLLVLLTTVVQLLAPMTLRQQKRALVISEALSAWSALKVFVMAVYVGALQMAQVSGFILDGPCRSLNDYIIPALQYGILPESIVDPRPHTNQCFIIEAQPRTGVYVLMAASFLSFLTVHCIGKLSKAAIVARFEHPEKFGSQLDSTGSGGAASSSSPVEDGAELDSTSSACCCWSTEDGDVEQQQSRHAAGAGGDDAESAPGSFGDVASEIAAHDGRATSIYGEF